jgi:hypothetical protein
MTFRRDRAGHREGTREKEEKIHPEVCLVGTIRRWVVFVVAVIEEPNNRLVDDAHRLLQYCVMSFRPAHVVFVLIS